MEAKSPWRSDADSFRARMGRECQWWVLDGSEVCCGGYRIIGVDVLLGLIGLEAADEWGEYKDGPERQEEWYPIGRLRSIRILPVEPPPDESDAGDSESGGDEGD